MEGYELFDIGFDAHALRTGASAGAQGRSEVRLGQKLTTQSRESVPITFLGNSAGYAIEDNLWQATASEGHY